jgi:Raf kinase inhibitor-like YbhB/YbcL family protein
MIPDKYSKDSGNISLPLAWTGVPEGARSLALIVDDPDAPSGTFVHWLAYGISPDTTELKENLSAVPKLPDGSRQGRNGFDGLDYGGRSHPAARIDMSSTFTHWIPVPM